MARRRAAKKNNTSAFGARSTDLVRVERYLDQLSLANAEKSAR